MGDIYRSIKRTAEAEITEKKSRFIAYLSPIRTAQEAEEFITKIRKKHYDATHNVYAYRVADGFQKYSDDGEPSRTAGFPVMELMEHEGITDTVCVVTRYFGGTLLGTGGLIRAYTRAAQEGLAAAGVLTLLWCDRLRIDAPYTFLSKIEHILRSGGYRTEDIQYAEGVTVMAIVEKERTAELLQALADAFGNGVIAQVTESLFADPTCE